MSYHNYRQFRGTVLRSAITVGLGSQLITVPALWAQNADPATKTLESTVVTGSLLSGAEAEGSLSVTAIDMASPVNGGFANLSDVFRLKLPQMGGTGNLNEGYGNGVRDSRSWVFVACQAMRPCCWWTVAVLRPPT